MRENPRESKPLAYSYVRMSTTAQLKGDSLRRQSEPARKYALENGLTFVEDFDLQDIGFSAYSGKNVDAGQLGKFIRAAEDGLIPSGSYLIAESLDRLTRQKILPSLELFLRILKAGVNIVTLIDRQIYRPDDIDPMKLLQSISFMARAHDESEHKSRRLSESWQNKRNNAKLRKLTARAPAWLRIAKDRMSFEVHEARAAIVRRIFDDASVGLGSYAIARALNAEEVPSFGKSREWIKSSVTKILTERAVLGEYQPHKRTSGKRVPIGEPIPDYYPQIVSRQVYDSVQLGRAQRATFGKGRKGPTLSNLFTNIAVCDYCQSPMHYINKGNGPKGGTFLKCSKAHNGADCSPKAWKYSDFETSFLYFCRELDLPELLREGAKKNEFARISENIRIAEMHLTGLERQRDISFSMLQNDKISSEYVISQIEDVEGKIKNVKSDIQALKKKLKDGIAVNVDEADLLRSISLFSNSLLEDDLRKRQLLRKRISDIVESITIAPNGDRKISILQVTAELAAVKKMIGPEYANFADRHHEMDNRPFSPDSHAPLFTVTFANKVVRIVVVDPENPTKFNAIFESVNGKLRVSQRWFGVRDLPGVESLGFE